MPHIVSADVGEVLAAANALAAAAHAGAVGDADMDRTAALAALLPGAHSPVAVRTAVSAVNDALADIDRRFADHARRTASAANALDDTDHAAAESITRAPRNP